MYADKNRYALTLAGAVLAAMALAGCGGTSTDAPEAPASSVPAESSAASESPSEDAAASVDLMVADSEEGEIVVDGEGMSLYYFTKDTKDSDTSACTGDCLVAWPIAVASSDTPMVEGVTGTVGTIESPDGELHMTLNGMPLYYFEKDKAPGDILGQGVGEVWYLAAPDGEMIK
ncbi:COG4315 family predicted lipoprotein [Arthrobacter sp. KK5.5]|uniref:COG4315 family predicted lipoprotein n=1 Tax=Arthrobacter sp. KK5.5 TaxID=3373084 RepID=UPI003EE7FA29